MLPYFDLHCDTIFECKRRGQGLRDNNLHLDLNRLTKASSPAAQVFAIWARPQELLSRAEINGGLDTTVADTKGAELYELCRGLLASLIAEFQANADILRHCQAYGDIEATPEGSVSALISVEGAELLDCSISKLETVYRAGVRILNLCWNFDNCLTGSAAGASGGGLTKQGREFVRAAQDMGVILDMSHISDEGFWDVLSITKKPLIASHSNSRSLCGNGRNLTDDMFRALAEQGGLVGINLYPEFLGESRDLAAAADHIEHFLSLGGEKAICLGGDLDGIDTLPADYAGVQDTYKIYDILISRGYSDSLCRDLLYNNALKFFARSL